MNYDYFKNLSCYEEFEIQSDLTGISKVDVLKAIGRKVNDYYFFISNDGILNWFDLDGNHVKDPGVLKEIKRWHIPYTITKCIIPNSVTSIGNDAFYDCESLKEITIPDSVTSIGSGAFSHCISLKEITIPDSVTSIDTGAFAFCISLKEITIPDSITSIGNNAFYKCESLTSITIPNSIKSINYKAFAYCESLTSITVSNNVTSIGALAFSNCKSLKEVVFKGTSLNKVKRMMNYPSGLEDESIIKCEI